MPKYHILMDALAVINGGIMRLQTGEKIEIDRWDMIIAHPPCTYLSNAAVQCHSVKVMPINCINARTQARIQAMDFFMKFVFADCDKIAIENPIGVMNKCYRAPDQIINPYDFAKSINDAENYVTKTTCLWLKGLKPLVTNGLPKPNNAEIWGRYSNGKAKCWTETSTRSAAMRSKTFPGIAKAMAEQWG